jgi:catechol 2,3-dioxygenase-like lactoylglutathione lyase family enzyme
VSSRPEPTRGNSAALRHWTDRQQYSARMPQFHHVNLGVPPGGVDAEAGFLVDILGYRPVEIDERLRSMGVHWFEADDGSQVHLSTDPDHRPAARAHVALHYGAGLAGVGQRLDEAAIAFDTSNREGFPMILNCRDPAGNRWELRGETVPAS